MNDILFTSVLVSDTIPLDLVSNYFKMHKTLKWKDYIVISGYHLEMVLKYATENKFVYIYDFGAITFVNMHMAEIKIFVEYLVSIVGPLDYNLFLNSCEAHTTRMLDDNQCYLCSRSLNPTPFDRYIIPITAEILAQSETQEKIEGIMSTLLDEAELMLTYLRKGHVKARSRKIVRITSKIVKFQYDTIKSIHIFDRPKFSGASIKPKEVHDELSEFYELYDRFHVIDTKSKDLLNLYSTYSDLGDKKIEYRLYKLQAILLLLFPLNSLIGDEIKQSIFWLIKAVTKLVHSAI